MRHVHEDICNEKSDTDLIRLTLQDKDYFACVIYRYEARLLRYIRRITDVALEEAEDILQEVFIKTYINLHDFDETLNFSSWIYRIARNHVISMHRKRMVRPEGWLANMDDSSLENLAGDMDIVGEVDAALLGEHLRKVINCLQDPYKEIVILRFFEEKEYKEISDIMKIPMGTVATYIRRAKNQLHKKLQKEHINTVS
ncbi:MAG: hypothetical protein COU90_01095 [Candidatus Ryanbacteria bacterium CG10_big_fil_rev_8_21_14_0_10_43_42]|uniref:RNA polymerase sigma factor n=1 Tax=Candidatus Ryanbacteria bacterium CG10_big_fil_rev_8_21_14_0_10_43_42 TaxID=1974864 RepID=A0A2M8KY68_9BACT|nr:MAG: hypothetical protein COU90_01095 [Candidatus Ryanbacteria bacterium CG10_big_fil_rev_8_21_14_0_10_43_42]